MTTRSVPSSPLDRFLTRLEPALAEGNWVKLSLGHPSQPEGGPLKWQLKPAEIRGELRCLQVALWKNRDETKHVPMREVLPWVRERLQGAFLNAVLFTESAEVHLDLARKPKLRVVERLRPAATLGHDRIKQRKLKSGAAWLQELGVTDSAGRVRMKSKFRQIERFLDLLDAAYRGSGLAARAVRLCDMGCGKGYLTFAAADYLRQQGNEAGEVVGVELRGELVALCNEVAQRVGADGLRFLEGTIEAVGAGGGVDILVALHACDTATDEALAAGIRGGASVILVAPCCHKEARRQFRAPKAEHPLRDLLRHGLFAERQAEMVTDALRVLLLEREGYQVTVSEFVDAEHTAKNVMISAVRSELLPARVNRSELSDRITSLKALYGITHHRLETLLQK